MECPHCKNEIKYVIVASACWQKAFLTKDNKVDFYSVPEVGATTSTECPKCGNALIVEDDV